jgi:hypothetical protein
MVSPVFSMQGAGLVVGPLLATILLSTGMSHDIVWRLLLAFGAIPALAMFWLRRQIKETPRFILAQIEAAEADDKARQQGRSTGMRGLLEDSQLLLWAVPGATKSIAPFLVLFGATYFFGEFGPNTTTFVYPAEIFPARVRTSSHGIAAAAGKLGAFVGTYALTGLLSGIGLGETSLIVGSVAVLGAMVTVTTLPEPKAQSLEALTEQEHFPASTTVLGLAQSRALRPPPV